MKKIIWIDVGTHFAQEYNSIFGSNINFFKHAFRRFLGGKILNRGKFISFQELKEIINSRNILKKESDRFYKVFVEANPKIAYSKEIYKSADIVFNLALTNFEQKSVSVVKLYLGNDSELSQGSSVFLEKSNINKDTYVPTLGVFTNDFFYELEKYLAQKFEDYDVLLRLNCEGVEDDVIYSAHKSFGSKLKLICGSLKDVEAVKGFDAAHTLDNFIIDNNLLFQTFHSGMTSWSKAHAVIINLMNQKN